jgi:hypothetical protein
MTPVSIRKLNTSCLNNRLIRKVNKGKIAIMGETTITSPMFSAEYMHRTPTAMLIPASPLHIRPPRGIFNIRLPSRKRYMSTAPIKETVKEIRLAK